MSDNVLVITVCCYGLFASEAFIEVNGGEPRYIPYLADVIWDDHKLELRQSTSGNIPGLEYWTPGHSREVNGRQVSEYLILDRSCSVGYGKGGKFLFWVREVATDA